MENTTELLAFVVSTQRPTLGKSCYGQATVVGMVSFMQTISVDSAVKSPWKFDASFFQLPTAAMLTTKSHNLRDGVEKTARRGKLQLRFRSHWNFRWDPFPSFLGESRQLTSTLPGICHYRLLMRSHFLIVLLLLTFPSSTTLLWLPKRFVRVRLLQTQRGGASTVMKELILVGERLWHLPKEPIWSNYAGWCGKPDPLWALLTREDASGSQIEAMLLSLSLLCLLWRCCLLQHTNPLPEIRSRLSCLLSRCGIKKNPSNLAAQALHNICGMMLLTKVIHHCFSMKILFVFCVQRYFHGCALPQIRPVYDGASPPQCLLLCSAERSTSWQFGSVMAFGCRAQIRVMMVAAFFTCQFPALRQNSPLKRH